MRRILLATDGSEPADRAASFAGALSKAFDAQVDVINVVSDRALVAPGMHSYSTGFNQLEEIHSARQALLESAGASIVTKASREVEAEGGAVGREEVVVGEPASEIVSHANMFKSDCIVMGRRGLGDAKGLLVGSVTHKVGQLTDITLMTTT